MNPAAGAEPAAKQPLTAETLWQMKRLGTPTLSPDGRTAVVPVSRFDVKENKGFTELWRLPTDPAAATAPRQLTFHESKASEPAYSPDGRWIVFVSKRGEDKEGQLYLLPTDGGEARRLTEVPTGAGAPKWFPDSRRIAFISRVWPALSWEEMKTKLKEKEESKVSAQQWDRAGVRWWDHWVDERQAHLYAIDVEGGEPRALTLGTGLELDRSGADTDSYDVAPDGKEIAFAADSADNPVDPNFDVFVLSLEEGATPAAPRNLTTDNPGQDMIPLYSPDGRYLAYGRQTLNGFYADTRRLMLYDRTTGETVHRTAEWDRSADGLVWAPDGKALYGSIDDAGHRRIYRFDVGQGTPTPVALTGDGTFTSLAIAGPAASPVLLALRQTFVEPPTLVRLGLEPQGTGGVTQTRLSSFNDEIVAGVDFGRYESVTFEGARGDQIQMWITYPPGFDESRQYPLYLLIHGGPHNGITDSFHWRWNSQVFAGWGYVTAWFNFHGSSGFGQEFTDSINPDRADMPYEDTLKAAAFLAAKPWIDGERMAAGGGSYGGYLVSVLLGREHPFKTLIAHAAVYNMYTQYGADYGAGKRRHGEHWQSDENFRRNSPHLGAGNFSTPTLVIHGQQDFRVPINHGLELFNTLQNRGVRSRLIYYPDENHWILKPQNSIHWYRAKEEWLKEYLEAPGETAGG